MICIQRPIVGHLHDEDEAEVEDQVKSLLKEAHNAAQRKAPKTATSEVPATPAPTSAVIPSVVLTSTTFVIISNCSVAPSNTVASSSILVQGNADSKPKAEPSISITTPAASTTTSSASASTVPLTFSLPTTAAPTQLETSTAKTDSKTKDTKSSTAPTTALGFSLATSAPTTIEIPKLATLLWWQ